MSESCVINVDENVTKINRIEISPNGTYLVGYSKPSNTIVGWKVVGQDVKEGEDMKVELNDFFEFELHDEDHICVSDNKILCINYCKSGGGTNDDFSKYIIILLVRMIMFLDD